MSLDKTKIKKILLNSLTNIGDVILTFPAIDILKNDFPDAKLSVIVGPKAQDLLKDNPHFHKVYVYDKRQSPKITIPWVFELFRERFDLVVDLRNSAIPFMIAPRYRTSCFVRKKDGMHMREKHLRRLREVYPYTHESSTQYALFISQEITMQIADFRKNRIGDGRKYVVIAPGTAFAAKRWPAEKFAEVADYLAQEFNFKIVFAGDHNDRLVSEKIREKMKAEALDICAEMSLIQLAEIMKHSQFCLVNDSAPMHLASYLNVPVLALFAFTDPKKYGPWGENGFYLRNNETCDVCQNKGSVFDHTCINGITSRMVIDAIHISRDTVTFQAR